MKSKTSRERPKSALRWKFKKRKVFWIRKGTLVKFFVKFSMPKISEGITVRLKNSLFPRWRPVKLTWKIFSSEKVSVPKSSIRPFKLTSLFPSNFLKVKGAPFNQYIFRKSLASTEEIPRDAFWIFSNTTLIFARNKTVCEHIGRP